jgi:hypothetical protein
MGQHLIIRRDDLVATTATTVMDDDDYDADCYAQRQYPSEYRAQAHAQAPLNPGKWRNFRFRFGAMEFTYTSARVDPPRPPREVLADPRELDRRGPERIARISDRHDRRSFYDRFIDHLGVTAAVLVFLGGAGFIATMQSRALVGSGSALGRIEMRDAEPGQQANFPIVTSDIITPSQPKAYAVRGAVISAPAPASIDDEYASARVPAPRVIADTAARAPAFRAAIPQSRDAVAPAAPPKAITAPVKASASLGAGSWERNPIISAAIDRAFVSGDLQNWQVGSTEGVVVVGDAIEMNGKQCRSGSILARKIGEEARTQAFERCRAL